MMNYRIFDQRKYFDSYDHEKGASKSRIDGNKGLHERGGRGRSWGLVGYICGVKSFIYHVSI